MHIIKESLEKGIPDSIFRTKSLLRMPGSTSIMFMCSGALANIVAASTISLPVNASLDNSLIAFSWFLLRVFLCCFSRHCCCERCIHCTHMLCHDVQLAIDILKHGCNGSLGPVALFGLGSFFCLFELVVSIEQVSMDRRAVPVEMMSSSSFSSSSIAISFSKFPTASPKPSAFSPVAMSLP